MNKLYRAAPKDWKFKVIIMSMFDFGRLGRFSNTRQEVPSAATNLRIAPMHSLKPGGAMCRGAAVQKVDLSELRGTVHISR